MSSESPPSPEARTQLIIVGSTDEDEVGTVVSEAQPGGEDGSTTTTTTETVVSEANGGSVTYRVVSTNDDSVIGSPMNGGQFYVIGNPSEVIGSVSAPSSVTLDSPNTRIGKTGNPLRDDRRRATHNEVERRRRDMINTWIMKLARLIPNLANTSGKSNHSKGGILAKACEYLQNTKTQISRFEEIRKANEALTKENERLVQAVTNFRKENAALKKQVESLGVTPETIKFEL